MRELVRGQAKKSRIMVRIAHPRFDLNSGVRRGKKNALTEKRPLFEWRSKGSLSGFKWLETNPAIKGTLVYRVNGSH